MKHLASALFVVLLTVSAAVAQPASPPSERLFDAPLTQQEVPSVLLTSLPTSDLEAARTTDDSGPVLYGINRDVSIRSASSGAWTRLPDGRWLWRVRIKSPDAVNVSAELDGSIPPGSDVFVYGTDYGTKRRPIRADAWTSDTFWTPYVNGSSFFIEAVVPAPVRDGFDLEVTTVVHGFRDLDAALAGRYNKSGACNIDVACSIADPWRDQVNSVVRYTFSSSAGSGVCTGSLVNTTDISTVRPYVLTAEHCVSSESSANSMVFYFNYQNETCRPPGSTASGTITNDDPNDQTLSGSELRMSFGNFGSFGDISGAPDVTLVELNNAIPLSYNVFLNGWSIEGNAPTEAVTIHHPAGDGKRISFEYDPTTITAYIEDGPASGDTHIRVEDWDDGTTEGGSSGSPLYDTNQRVVGVLSGGFAACGNDRADWYGRLSEAWDGGGTPETRLRDWLDPDDTGAVTIDGRRKTLDPDDTTSPSAPADLTVATDPTIGQVTLSWIAPSDDADGASAVYAYDVRYATTPITTESEFNAASRVNFNGSPSAPGEVESLTLSLVPEQSYYFSVKAIDDNFNGSSRTSTTSPTALPDEIPPARPENLQATIADRDAEQVRLTWTAPGDDQNVRTVEDYQVRFSPEPITVLGDFEDAIPVQSPSTPVGPGQTEMVVVDVEPNTPYFFGVRAVDNKGNLSPLGTTDENRAIASSTLVLTPPSPSRVTETVSFRVATTERQTVRVAIYDVLGRRVRVVFDDVIDADQARAVTNLDLSGLSSGRYFIRALGDTGGATRPISVVR